MKTQLETTAGLTTTDLFQNDSAQGRVDKIRTEALAEVFDVTTAAGRKLCISQAGKVAKTKTAVDKIGKALSDSLNVERAKVMADRRIYNNGLSELKDDVRRPVTDWEAAEAEKVAKIAQAFADLETNSEAHNFTGELFSDVVLQAKLEKLDVLEVADFGDESAKAQELIFAGKTKIKAAIQQRKDADELAELRKLKAEKEAETERLAEVERIEAAAVAKHEAEQKQKELETASATEVEPDELMPTPRTRVEVSMPPVKPAPTPSKMPWLDESPQKRTALAINTKLIQDFCEHGCIEAGQARRILSAIEAGEIVNISINY